MRHISREVFATTLLIAAIGPPAAADYAMSSSPLAFGPDQTIVDLNKVDTWAPLELEGFPPGSEIAVLRGDLAHSSESIVRIPAGYVIPNHNHTSDEDVHLAQGRLHLYQRRRWPSCRNERARPHQPSRQCASARDQVR